MAENLTSGKEQKSAVHDDAPVHADTKGDPELNAGDKGGEHTPSAPQKYDEVTQRLVGQAQALAGQMPASQAVSHTGSPPMGNSHEIDGVGMRRVIYQGDIGPGAVKAAQKYANDKAHPWNASTGAREGEDTMAEGAASDPTQAQVDQAVESARKEIQSEDSEPSEG